MLFPIGTVITESGCQLDTTEKKDPQLKTCLHQVHLWGIFLATNECRRVQNTVGGAIPRQMGGQAIYKDKKVAE